MSMFDDESGSGKPPSPFRTGGSGGGPVRPFGSGGRRVPRLWVILGIVLFVIIFVPTFMTEMITDWMWFGSQNLAEVYATRLWLAIAVFFITLIIAAVFLLVNWLLAWRVSLPGATFAGQQVPISRRAVRWITVAAAAALGVIFALTAAQQWPTILLFLNGGSFGDSDPLFHNDIGFYVFGLPFWKFLRNWFIGLLIVAAIGAVIIYAIGSMQEINRQLIKMQQAQAGRRPARDDRFSLNLDPRIGVHLSILGAVFLLIVAIGYWLGRFDLLYSSRAVAYGAGYTDVNAKLPALYIMMVVAAITAILLLVNLRVRTWKLIVGALGLWLAALILVNGVYPAIIQEAVVRPNEQQLERPYIENNIAATRKAFGLDKFSEREVPAVVSLTSQDTASSQATVNNVRLWDYRPLLDTYSQLQEIRQYYTFNEVDIDRYTLSGTQRQVMLSARELSIDDLSEQSKTWQNEHLVYTHGYGAVVSPVNEIVGEGLPNLLVKNIPPESSAPELKITQPAIYYGLQDYSYVFVNTNQQEFDYPSGDNNVYTNYQGKGGVQMSNFFVKLLFALRFGDANVLLTSDITPQSRVLFHRQIQDAVQLLAPFLLFDHDPYLVIADGKLYWMQDAYTYTDLYPYSEPYDNGINYIRNSVKVVIDAYQGTATFYVADPTDPIIKAYRSIFPALFTDMSNMPASLRSHVRYPEDIMNVQARMYATFHMTNPQVFYSKEDQWNVPLGVQSEGSAPLEAFYVNMELPGSSSQEFALVLPFTPISRDNMIAWMAARSDGANYGKVEVIRYPKQQVVYGPKQIEARINQDPTISGQITLWSQSGSTVLRGNLLVIPIADSVLYVQPLFLQATASKFPELKRVITATGNSVGIGADLTESLQVAFKQKAAEVVGAGPGGVITTQPTPAAGTTPGPTQSAGPPGTVIPLPSGGSVADLTQAALQHYDAAQTALRQGDWTTYGREMDAMKAALDQLSAVTGVPTALPGASPTP